MPLPRSNRFSEAPPHVVIVGGGITGLSAAYRLQTEAEAQGHPISITLLEQSGRLGGKIWTERRDGFVVELGPDIFLARKPRGIGLCRDLGLDHRIQETNPTHRGSYIQKEGVLHRLPEGLSGLVPTRLGPVMRSPLLSTRGKLRLALDWIRPPRREEADESVAGFITRRLGEEAYSNLVEPLLGGIYGGDGHALSLQATFPQLRAAERDYGSLLRGLLKSRAAAKPTESWTTAFVTLQGGMDELIVSLAAHLTEVDIRLSQPVLSITRLEEGYAVHTGEAAPVRAEAVVITTPAHVAAHLLASLKGSLTEELSAIPHGSTMTLSMAFRAADVPRPLDAYGYIIPRAEGKPVLACTWSSTKIPGRAPEGMVLLRVFLGRSDTDALFQQDDDLVVTVARREVEATLGITATPLFYRLCRWRRSMPQYVLGHLERLARIEQRQAAHPGLFLAGASYRGVGIPDCIEDGERAARQTLAFLLATEAASVTEP